MEKLKNSKKLRYKVRNMKIEDIPHVQRLQRAEKWFDGCNNLQTWFSFDPKGFKVAESEKGDIIGFGIAINFNKDLAIIGMGIVDKPYRGLGIGKKLLIEIGFHVKTRNVAVNSVQGMLKRYQKTGLIRTVETDWSVLMNGTDDKVSSQNLSYNLPEGVCIQPYQEESHFNSIAAFDRVMMDFDRQVAMLKILRTKDSMTFVAVRDNECVGFGMIQPNLHQGCHVTPLYAQEPAIAESLLKKLIDNFPTGNGFEITICSQNVAANCLLNKLGCEFKTEKCIRLYRRGKVNTNLNWVYGMITDYSLF